MSVFKALEFIGELRGIEYWLRVEAIYQYRRSDGTWYRESLILGGCKLEGMDEGQLTCERVEAIEKMREQGILFKM